MVLSLGTGLLWGFLWSLIYRVAPSKRVRLMTAGFLGAWLGNYFWQTVGPAIYGFVPIPTLLGAAFCCLIVQSLAQSSH